MHLDEVKDLFTEHWRPGWGSVAVDEVMYMQEVIRRERPRHFLEVGMASGLSAGLLARVLEENGAETLTTIDHDNTFFGDTTKENGFLIDAIYPDGKVTVNRMPFTTSCDIPRLGMHFDMAFVDANHQHPWPLIDTLFLYPFMTGARTVFHHDLRLFRIQDVLFGIGPKYLYDQFPDHLRTRSTANHGNLFMLRMPTERAVLEEIAADAFCLPWSLRTPLSPQQAARIRQGLAGQYSGELVEVFETALKRFNAVDRLRLGV